MLHFLFIITIAALIACIIRNHINNLP